MVHLALELLCLIGLNQLRATHFYANALICEISNEWDFLNYVDDLFMARMSNQLTDLVGSPSDMSSESRTFPSFPLS